MRNPVRAKFRILKKTVDWRGTAIYEFAPVLKDSDDESENSLFWSASPSGEMQLTFKEDPKHDIGAYYYLDFTPVELSGPPKEDPRQIWGVDKVTRHFGGQTDVRMSPRGGPLLSWSSYFQVQIDHEKTEAHDSFGDGSEPDNHWTLDITFAEPSDD